MDRVRLFFASPPGGSSRGGRREWSEEGVAEKDTNRLLNISYHPFLTQLSTMRGLRLPMEQPAALAASSRFSKWVCRSF